MQQQLMADMIQGESSHSIFPTLEAKQGCNQGAYQAGDQKTDNGNMAHSLSFHSMNESNLGTRDGRVKVNWSLPSVA